jgi:hypothetical protein
MATALLSVVVLSRDSSQFWNKVLVQPVFKNLPIINVLFCVKEHHLCVSHIP